MPCDWLELEPCAGISSDEGLLGPGRGGGAGMCDKPSAVLSNGGSPADSAVNSVGRHGGLRSNLNGMVLRNFQTTPTSVVGAQVELSL